MGGSSGSFNAGWDDGWLESRILRRTSLGWFQSPDNKCCCNFSTDLGEVKITVDETTELALGVVEMGRKPPTLI